MQNPNGNGKQEGKVGDPLIYSYMDQTEQEQNSLSNNILETDLPCAALRRMPATR